MVGPGAFDEALEQRQQRHNLTRAEADLLITVATAPDAHLTPRALAAAAHVKTGMMTRMLDRLERRGLVRRIPHPTDRRSTLVELTGAGQAAQAAAGQTQLQVLTQGLEWVATQAELRTLQRVLSRLVC